MNISGECLPTNASRPNYIQFGESYHSSKKSLINPPRSICTAKPEESYPRRINLSPPPRKNEFSHIYCLNMEFKAKVNLYKSDNTVYINNIINSLNSPLNCYDIFRKYGGIEAKISPLPKYLNSCFPSATLKHERAHGSN